MADRTSTFEERFWSKVEKSGPDDCWPWRGAISGTTGYGNFYVNSRTRLAHRVAYELSGRDLDDEHIDHMCFNRTCVNPRHLRAVTRQQNNQNYRKLRDDNTSGVRGVTKRGTKWIAQVGHKGRNHYVGIFNTLEEAAEAARLKRCELFTHNDIDRLVG